MSKSLSESDISSKIRGRIRAARELTEDQVSRFDNMGGDEYAKLFDIPDPPMLFEDVKPYLQEYKKITDLFVASVEDLPRHKKEFEKDSFLIEDRNFDGWFEVVSGQFAPKLLSYFEASDMERSEEKPSRALRQLKGIAEGARHVIQVPSYIRLYCLELPLLFPPQRSELARVGARMAAIRYLELLSNRLHRIVADKDHPADTSLEELEPMLRLRQVATILSR